MAIRIGGIEFTGVQELYTEESRTLVEQRSPEQQGSQFQDLGREPVTIVLEGLLFSADSLPDLEKLREAQIKGEPLAFAADIAVGTELTQVVIEDLRVRQVAGYQSRYRYMLRLREYTDPPQSADAARAPVNDGIQADADTWAADSLAAADVLEDPASLPAVLDAQPSVLDHLSAEDLGSGIALKADSLSGEQFGNILSSVSDRDPTKAVGLIQSVADHGKLGGLMQKLSDAGADIGKVLKGIDFKKAGSLIRALKGGLEFLKKLKEVIENAGKLAKSISHFDPLPEKVRSLLEGRKP